MKIDKDAGEIEWEGWEFALFALIMLVYGFAFGYAFAKL